MSNRYNKSVGLRSILKLPEVKAQIAEGDLSVEDLESAWLEACAVKVRCDLTTWQLNLTTSLDDLVAGGSTLSCQKNARFRPHPWLRILIRVFKPASASASCYFAASLSPVLCSMYRRPSVPAALPDCAAYQCCACGCFIFIILMSSPRKGRVRRGPQGHRRGQVPRPPSGFLGCLHRAAFRRVRALPKTVREPSSTPFRYSTAQLDVDIRPTDIEPAYLILVTRSCAFQ